MFLILVTFPAAAAAFNDSFQKPLTDDVVYPFESMQINKEATRNPAGIYVLKVNNRNTGKRCEVCSKLTIKTPELCSGVFIIKFEHISHFVLVFLLLTLNM